jgi:hypothetical protein
MSRPLIPVGALINESWNAFLKDWQRTFRIAAWVILAPAIMFALALGGKLASEGLYVLLFPVGLAGVVIALWTVIRLFRHILAMERDGKPESDESRMAWNLFLPFLWVTVLENLAVLGGFVAFVVPGIWLAILLNFSILILLDRNLRGTQALAASAELVKGRWWATFARIAIPGLVFLFLAFVAVGVITLAIGMIVGFAKLELLATPDPGTTHGLIAASLQNAVQGLVQAALLPLLVTWQVKLYRSLKETR